MRSVSGNIRHTGTPLAPAVFRRWATLLILTAAVPASVVGAIVVYVPETSGARWSAVAVALAPVLLGYLVGRWAWPGDEDRWAATIRLAIASGTLWVAGVVSLALFYIAEVCATRAATPALLAGAVVYLGIALSTVHDGDFAFLAWPAAVLAGLAVILVVMAAGPHGVCYT